MKKFVIDIEHFDQYSIVLKAEKISIFQIKDFYIDLSKRFRKVVEFDRRFENSIHLYFWL